MTKISVYNIDENVTSNDKWIGSDGNNQNRTKNFTPKKIADYFNRNEVIDTSNSIRYIYDTIESGQQRKNGTISFKTEIGPLVPIDSITTFVLSKYTQGSKDVTDFLNILPTTKIILHKSDNINIFGIFRVVSVVVDPVEVNFFNVSVEFLSSNGSLEEDKDYIISLIDLQNVVQIPQLVKETFNYTSNNSFIVSNAINNVLQVIVNTTSLHPNSYEYTLPSQVTVLTDLEPGDVVTVVYNYIEEFLEVPNLQRVTDEGNTTTNSIEVATIGGDAISGITTNGIGVKGVSTTGDAIVGTSEDGVGVSGYSESGLAGYFNIGPDNESNIVEFKNNFTTEASVSKDGEYSGSAFIKDGGTSAEYLMADGSTTPILGYTPVDVEGDTMLGSLILHNDPTNALEAVTKQYVDNIVAGVNFHSPVHTATTGNVSATYTNGASGVGAKLTSTTNGAIQVDGEFPAHLDRVLVWQQTNAIENGIYDVTVVGDGSTPFELTRSSDADNSPPGEIHYGDYTLVLSGDTNGGFGFICNTSGTIDIGITPINYVQFNAAQAVTAGYGLKEVTSNVIEIDPLVTQEKITLTTTGSGAATLISNTLNIPQADNYWTKTGNNIQNNTTGGVVKVQGGTGAYYDNAFQTVQGTGVVGFSVQNGGNVFCAYLYPSNIQFASGGSLFIGGGGPNGPYFSGIGGTYGPTGTSYWKSNIKIKYTEDLSTSYDDRTLVDKGYITSYTAAQLAGKMNNPSLTASYIPKALTATTIGNSRLLDTGTYLGIGTVNAPTKDITLGNQDNREVGIEESTNIVVGRDLTINAGRTVNYVPSTGFIRLNLLQIQYYGADSLSNGDILITGNGNIVYKLVAGSPPFVNYGIAPGGGMISIHPTNDNIIYATGNGTNLPIYISTNGGVSFSAIPGITPRNYRYVKIMPNGDAYATISDSGDIYKRTGGTGDFIAMGFTSKLYKYIISTPSGDAYFPVAGDDIYKINSGTSVLTALGQTFRNWANGYFLNGDLYIAVGGTSYKQTGLAGNFVLNTLFTYPVNPVGVFLNVTVSKTTNNVYVPSYDNDVWVQYNNGEGTVNLKGGTLKLNAGTGKGTGASDIELYTGQVLASGTDMQTATLRAKIDNTGLMTLPSVTNALIDADTTNKAVVTKEYVSTIARPYKVYTALLTQSGTNAPTATVLENTLGSYSLNYVGFGYYSIVFNVVFSSVAYCLQDGLVCKNANPDMFALQVVQNANTMLIYTRNPVTNASLNGVLLNTYIEIRVYN